MIAAAYCRRAKSSRTGASSTLRYASRQLFIFSIEQGTRDWNVALRQAVLRTGSRLRVDRRRLDGSGLPRFSVQLLLGPLFQRFSLCIECLLSRRRNRNASRLRENHAESLQHAPSTQTALL
jgi:hypothetical protein